MFIRTKKIKGHPYAYLVENTWKHESSRQKVSKYLGRVHVLAETGKTDAAGIDGCSYEDSIRALVRAQLCQLGFVHGQGRLTCGTLSFDLISLTLKDTTTTKSQVLKSNDGFVCDHTLFALISMQKSGDDQHDGLALARACVAAGLDISKEQFVELYEQLTQRPPQHI